MIGPSRPADTTGPVNSGKLGLVTTFANNGPLFRILRRSCFLQTTAPSNKTTPPAYLVLLFFSFALYTYLYICNTRYAVTQIALHLFFFYFFSGEIGQKQNGTRFPLTSDGVMSSRLNSHFFHDDQCKCSCQWQ